MFNRKNTTILLVEDDPGHARLIEKNLRRARITNPIVTVGNGRQALEYLSRPDASGITGPSPGLVMLLDLNLPLLDGFQVLRRVKTNARTRHIPVIVLTTTDDRDEQERCLKLGCNAFVTKSVNFRQFSKAIQALKPYL